MRRNYRRRSYGRHYGKRRYHGRKGKTKRKKSYFISRGGIRL